MQKKRPQAIKTQETTSVEIAQRDRQVYALARRYVLDLIKRYVLKPEDEDAVNTPVNAKVDDQEERAEAVLNKYLQRGQVIRPATIAGLDGLYHHLIHSSQDWALAPSVIGNAIGGVDKLEAVLQGFNPGEVVRLYPDVNHWEPLLDAIVDQLEPRGKVRRGPQSLWPRFCKTAISSALFLERFGSAEEFYAWADAYDKDPPRRIELPREISGAIYGYGFALACMFLMSIGYSNYGKTDIHVKKIFMALDLCSSAGDEEVFAAMVRVASHAGVTPFCVDQIFWLAGSGNFHRDNAKAGRQRDRFISHAQAALASASDAGDEQGQRDYHRRCQENTPQGSSESLDARRRAASDRFIWQEGDIEIIKRQNPDETDTDGLNK